MEPDPGLDIIAHRGIHNTRDVEENSREAVERAFDSEVDGLEVDLQLLGDGTIVLCHDDVIKNAHEVGFSMLGNLTYETFKTIIPFEPLSLTELLELDWKGKRVILECKSNRNTYSFVRRLLLVLAGTEVPSSLTLSSYDWNLLLELMKRTSVELAPVVNSFVGLTRRYLTDERLPEWHVDVRSIDDPRVPELTQNRDVILWTVNDPNQLEELERMGIKGIMTDNPEAF